MDLVLNNVTYAYKNRKQRIVAINDVSFSCKRGTTSAIIGKSGSGKTTLLSVIGGLILPTKGVCLWNGVSTADRDLDAYRRNTVAMIHQNYNLFPNLSVRENVLLPALICHKKAENLQELCDNCLEQMDIPKHCYDRTPSALSGGEQQRVAIARAMMSDAKLILADEPTGNLDGSNADRIRDHLISLAKEKNCCVIVVTHDHSLAERMDQTWMIEEGNVRPA